MPQFSIRQLLLGTSYIAVGCAVSSVAGFEYFLWFNLLLVHVAVAIITSVGAIEYTGHRRRFCVASLVTLCGFLTYLSLGHFNVGFCNFLSIIGLAATYLAGLFAAGTFRAIVGVDDPDDAGRILCAVTRLLAKLLPSSKRP